MVTAIIFVRVDLGSGVPNYFKPINQSIHPSIILFTRNFQKITLYREESKSIIVTRETIVCPAFKITSIGP